MRAQRDRAINYRYPDAMTPSIHIWTSAAFHEAYRCGGWACVRADGGRVVGAAGGERHTTADRMALAGLVAALRDVPAPAASGAGALIAISTTSPELALFTDVLTKLGAPRPAAPPEADLDLWAQILTGAAGRRLTLRLLGPERDAPGAFTAAWADLARDKAKASGPFRAAIPRANLAKLTGLSPI